MGHGSSTVDGASAPCIKSEQMKARLPAKASDYGLERFNRLLERLDRGNFLIKTSFKKSYSLILMSARGSIPSGDPAGSGSGVACGVESSGNDSTASTNTANGDSKTDGSGPTVGCNSSSISNSSNSSTGAPSSGTSGPGANFKRLQQQTDKRPLGGSLRGWYPRTRGILIKANSSTGIYQLAGAGRTESATMAQVDNHHQQFVSHIAPSTELSPTERRISGQRKAVPGTDLPETTPTNTTAASGHHYNGNSLTPDDSVNDDPAAQNTGSEKDQCTNNESDALCRSEVYDNDSGSGSGGRTDQLLNNRTTLRTSPRKANVEPCRNNYENIRPSTHRSRQRLSSLDGTNHTLGSGTRKPTARKKSNAASTGSEWDEDSWMPYGLEDGPDGTEHKLSSSFPHTSSGYYWQSTECPVPTRFFQRQDYVQPATTDSAALDFPLDRSHAPTQDDGEQAADRERSNKRTQPKKRWLSGSKGGKNKTLSTVVLDVDSTDIKTTMGNKDTADHPFQLTSLFGTGSHSGNHGRKRQERVPQLKNINLHFPNKTSHHQQQQQQQQHHGYDEQTQHELRSSRAPTGNIPPGALFHQPSGYHQLSLPPQTVVASHQYGATGRGERKYFNKAKSHFLKLGQKWRLLTVSGGKARATHRTGTGHQQQQQQQQQHHISSYNLDDLIKATHRYGQENESANLSQKIVYKSYKSELDLTKNLAYLDSFLNEYFDQDGDRPRTVGRYSRHKCAKSCSKTLDPSLKVAALNAGRVGMNTDDLAGMPGEEDPGTDSTLEATAVTVPFGCVSSNLIQFEDVWEGTGRSRGQWITTNTSSSSSEYLRNNLSSARSSSKPNVKANKMRDFFRFDGASGGVEDSTYGKVKDGEEEDEEDDDEDEDEEEDDENLELEDDDDARMLLFDSLAPFMGGSGNSVTVGPVSARTIQGAFVEQYGKNNATSSSLSSSDYASVYSATSSGGNGATSTPGPAKSSLHGTQFKLLATPEEGTAGECATRVDYSPQKHHQSSPKQQRAHHLPRMNVMSGNNVTNPFVTLSAGEIPAGNSSHRIYNNFLDGSPRHQAAPSVPGSPADKPIEKNHRLRKPQTSSGFPTGRLPSTGSVSPRGTDRYDYRMQQPKPSNSRSHFRQMAPVAPDTDLTYQEDYLEHYQNAARARSLQGGHGDTDPTLHFLHHEPYHRRRSALPLGGSNGEDLQNNALANENSDNDTDEESRMNTLVKASDGGSIVDDVATTDELLLLVNAAIDIRRSQAVEQPLLLGNARKKNARKELQRVSTQTETNRRVANEPLSDNESVANESKTLLTYRPQTQPQYDATSNQLYNGEFRSAVGTGDTPAPGVTGTRRTFAGLNHPPNGSSASSKSGSTMSNSYLGYGPHRVIVSQSRKERGEVVLEYEC